MEQGKVLYGNEFQVYNVHSMIHLADEVQEYGSLDACCAFPFENYMQKLKRFVWSGKNPIAQIGKRPSESYCAIPHFQEAVISLKKPDNCFILTDSCCCEVPDKSNHPDDGENEYLCRVYERRLKLYFIDHVILTSVCTKEIHGGQL